jgi:hypothetical protein
MPSDVAFVREQLLEGDSPRREQMAENPTPITSAPRPTWVRPDFEQFETAPEVTDYAARL